MTLKELRQPKVDEIQSIITQHKAQCKQCRKIRVGPGVIDLAGSKCDKIVPHLMFLYDLQCHDPNAEELAALAGGPVPEFLKPGIGGWADART